MNIHEIADKMAQNFNIDGLECQDSTIEIEIDGAFVRIEETDADIFIVSGLVGDAPSEGDEKFAIIALESNLALMNQKAAALTRNPNSNAYVLVERIPRSCAADFESFCESLGKFVDTLISWRNMLINFIPVQAQANLINAEKQSGSIEALRNMFLRV